MGTEMGMGMGMEMAVQMPILRGPQTSLDLDPVTMAVLTKTREDQIPKPLPNFGWILPPIP